MTPTPEPEAKMTQEDELVERLEHQTKIYVGLGKFDSADLANESAVTITRLKSYLAKLRSDYIHAVDQSESFYNELSDVKEQLASALEALKPFAVFVETNAGRLAKDGMQITVGSSMAHRQLTFGDCRRAAAELVKHKENG